MGQAVAPYHVVFESNTIGALEVVDAEDLRSAFAVLTDEDHWKPAKVPARTVRGGMVLVDSGRIVKSSSMQLIAVVKTAAEARKVAHAWGWKS